MRYSKVGVGIGEWELLKQSPSLAAIAASEKPDSDAEPMGPKARKWLLENLKKAASGTWKMGLTVATDVVKEALLKYYGLK